MKKKRLLAGLIGSCLVIVGITVALVCDGDDTGCVFLIFMGTGLIFYGGGDED
jgi:hypothetical protein